MLFTNMSGEKLDVQRETKSLLLKSVVNSDYYKGKNHDSFTFVDDRGVTYKYDASLNADMTEYDTKFGRELAFAKGKYVKFNAYFVRSFKDFETYMIYNPKAFEIAT